MTCDVDVERKMVFGHKERREKLKEAREREENQNNEREDREISYQIKKQFGIRFYSDVYYTRFLEVIRLLYSSNIA